MKFTIITHVPHVYRDNHYYGYAPYIREMNIWFTYVDHVVVVAPLEDKTVSPIHEPYSHANLSFLSVSEFNVTSVKNFLVALYRLPKVVATVYKAMKSSDHIHLRCPGNMGLIGAVVQIFFPKKQKTAKYAGNWDGASKQPFTYRLQRWILSNTFLTRNIQVLVYGDWPNQTNNIMPFFTASYSEEEILKYEEHGLVKVTPLSEEVRFLFVGTLSKGKQPLYAIQLVNQLKESGINVRLALFGDGSLHNELQEYIDSNGLANFITLRGNQDKTTVLNAYRESHFLLLPSKSEGWPKAVAEAMFWGCVPIATPVSCVPYMLGNGSRGLLLQEQMEFDVNQIKLVIQNLDLYEAILTEAKIWSRNYTTNSFEKEIKKLLTNSN